MTISKNSNKSKLLVWLIFTTIPFILFYFILYFYVYVVYDAPAYFFVRENPQIYSLRSLFPFACRLIGNDPGHRTQSIISKPKYVLEVRADALNVKTVQVYSGKSLGNIVDILLYSPNCQRVNLSHLVEQKEMPLYGSVSFVLPEGEYFVISINYTTSDSFKLIDYEHKAIPYNIKLNKDTNITPQGSYILDFCDVCD